MGVALKGSAEMAFEKIPVFGVLVVEAVWFDVEAEDDGMVGDNIVGAREEASIGDVAGAPKMSDGFVSLSLALKMSHPAFASFFLNVTRREA